MDFDFQLILYIIFFVIYILAKSLRKPAPKKPRQRPSKDSVDTEPPMTFEDIFREISGERKRSKPIRKPEVANIPTEFQSDYPTDEEIQKVYEDSKKEAREVKTVEQKVREEAKKKRVTLLKPDKFSAYNQAEGETLASTLGEMLKNPDEAQKAIILKEIFDRKF